jgi:putative oxidoreductase
MWTNLALLFLRVVVGGLFVGHGTQKAFGWFGGYGIAGTAGFMEQLGLKPGRLHATAAAFGETVGGLLVLLGLWTPVGAGLIVAVMLVAIKTVHLAKGIWNTNGGYEYPLTLIATALLLAANGPGAYTLPALLGR